MPPFLIKVNQINDHGEEVKNKPREKRALPTTLYIFLLQVYTHAIDIFS